MPKRKTDKRVRSKRLRSKKAPRTSGRARKREAQPRSDERARSGSLWSGTIGFGLVSVPVDLYSANRPRNASLRMVDADGTPLQRRYFCPREDRAIDRDEIVRGYEIEDDRYVVVTDEELESLAPKKSREIDLKLFVDVGELDPFMFERAYFLVPARDSGRAYRLLAAAMEQAGRAGIATFVMHDTEHLVAIIAENGVLRAETLRYAEELRSAGEVGLPERVSPAKELVRKLEREIADKEADTLDPRAMEDRYAERLRAMVERKRASNEDVVELPAEVEADSEGAEVIDLMAMLERSLKQGSASRRRGTSRGRASQRAKAS